MFLGGDAVLTEVFLIQKAVNIHIRNAVYLYVLI
jgi:hypothetical protein